ncbi:hypothetical protein K440DRAFT_34403 [Wilcoxina mikolae CBS 423.85]|nr:hypothetical protein K440DRAFT_34403 [Wilcoxina mikolae CBS 423.85]
MYTCLLLLQAPFSLPVTWRRWRRKPRARYRASKVHSVMLLQTQHRLLYIHDIEGINTQSARERGPPGKEIVICYADIKEVKQLLL